MFYGSLLGLLLSVATPVASEDVGLGLRLQGGRTRFFQGERIPLELVFSTRRPGVYQVNTAVSDRVGRMNMADTFQVSPTEGVVDPLSDWFLGWVSFGGAMGSKVLAGQDVVVKLDLNEWLRFDRPGRYTLRVTSQRVGSKSISLRLESTPVHFEIVPATPEWEWAAVEEALRAMASADETERRQGCRSLRFLRSEAALEAMARHYADRDSECSADLLLGLAGAHDAERALRIMEAQLGEPQATITSAFVDALARLASLRESGRRAPDGDEDAYFALAERSGELTAVYQDWLFELLPRKVGPARALTASELYEGAVVRAMQQNRDTAWLSQLAALVRSVLPELPMADQQHLLDLRWDRLADPELLPHLRALYASPPDRFSRSTALERIYELAPEEGRRLILAEIRSGRLESRREVLGRLPEDTLPELDTTMLRSLLANRTNYSAKDHAEVIERYATDAIFQEVRGFYEGWRDGPACWARPALLAYFLRVDASYGARALEQAGRPGGGCSEGDRRSLLVEVAKLRTSPELEAAAVRQLEASDLDAAALAAELLGRHGSAAAEAALWQRLESWNRQWKARPGKLQEEDHSLGFLVLSGAAGAVNLERALQHALAESESWLADRAKLERLQRLCLTEQARNLTGAWLSSWRTRPPLRVEVTPEGRFHVWVAHYHVAGLQSLAPLQRRLAQFPRGTIFEWQEGRGPRHDEVRSSLAAFLAERGMSLAP